MAAKKSDDTTAPEGGDTKVDAGVDMKVTTKGDGKIHTGDFIRGTHVPITFKKGETFRAPDKTAADQLMDRGLADTVD